MHVMAIVFVTRNASSSSLAVTVLVVPAGFLPLGGVKIFVGGSSWLALLVLFPDLTPLSALVPMAGFRAASGLLELLGIETETKAAGGDTVVLDIITLMVAHLTVEQFILSAVVVVIRVRIATIHDHRDGSRPRGRPSIGGWAQRDTKVWLPCRLGSKRHDGRHRHPNARGVIDACGGISVQLVQLSRSWWGAA